MARTVGYSQIYSLLYSTEHPEMAHNLISFKKNSISDQNDHMIANV